MKQLYYLFIALIFVSCQSDPIEEENGANNNDTITEQSIIDSTLEDDGQTFGQFFNDFIWDREGQQNHIEYPIQQGDKLITFPEDWEYEPFFTQRSYVPVLNSDDKHSRSLKTEEEDVTVSFIYFLTEEAQNYYFTKYSGEWMLRKIDRTPLNQINDARFIDFITQFSLDSVYQISHIQFPLPDHYPDDEYANVEDTLYQDEWKYFNMLEEIEGLMYYNEPTNSNIRYINYNGVENGISLHYTFERIDNEWKLVMIEDFST
ncbi:DUF4348 domain-containing protein [Paracrocinitomix mangrovi]|uniref:DUF4348 domain-containing protein n=1 Tax=Paracrocinitomix mangrovi TaxID=2862509 RepID=UPI001C8D5691|nr:DUF4348 domain-containing protein [Paracrocinitomix mangrovi]UKN01977.1 DUF4348 domain-containing protein [Paracrocinitomix mangrovi]